MLSFIVPTMKLSLDVSWVPGTRAAAFGDLLMALASHNPTTLVQAMPCIENGGWGAKLSTDGKTLGIHFRTRSGDLLPSPCATLSQKFNGPDLAHQAAPFIVPSEL